MIMLAQAVLVKDEDEDSAVDTAKTKKRASPRRRGLQSCRRSTTSRDCLRLARACWSRTRPRTVIGTSPSQWDYDQDSANCAAIWLEIAQLGHHDKGIGRLTTGGEQHQGAVWRSAEWRSAEHERYSVILWGIGSCDSICCSVSGSGLRAT